MKFCYVDESLAPNDPPVQVMVGIIVDAQRLNRTRLEFAEAFQNVETAFPEALKELKGSSILYGRKGWRNVDPEIRKQIFRDFGAWLTRRKHHLAIAAVDTTRFQDEKADNIPKQLHDLWVFGAVHIALQLQKKHQDDRGNKGHTVLIFDENKQKADKLNEVLFDPPDWTDGYYGRSDRQDALDQIVDSAFFTKSHHAGLAQVADLFAFVFRRYSELDDYGLPEAYEGEREDINEFIQPLRPRLIGKQFRWPSRNVPDSSLLINRLAPQTLVAL